MDSEAIKDDCTEAGSEGVEFNITSTDLDTALNVVPQSDPQRLSKEMLDFLDLRNEKPRDVLKKPVVKPPEPDDSFPLSHYFISTSHNTYLLSYQLMGKAHASAYTHVLSHHCRCVEIDVWYAAAGLIVTHGWTWSDHIPFRDVCVAIGDAVDPADWPVLISLECHVPLQHQDELVQVMKDVWGDKLVTTPVEGFEGREREITPAHLRGRILVMVEYHFDPNQSYSDSMSASECVELGDEETSDSNQLPNTGVVKATLTKIAPSLAALGIYCRSIKPVDGWLKQVITEPPHLLYNLSEITLGKLLPHFLEQLIDHSMNHMRRVYPKGTRVMSSNLSPLKYWASGTHISALNWQKYDRNLQFNEAMFVETGGWVLKPDALRGIQPSSKRNVRLTCEILGACNVPNPKLKQNIKAFVHGELFFPSERTKTFRSQSKHPSESSPPDGATADFFWNERFHWEYLEHDLSFIRLIIYQDEWLAKDRLGIFCARVDYLQPGWRFVRLSGKRGKFNESLLLVRFTRVTL